jgi:hypothetical protein
MRKILLLLPFLLAAGCSRPSVYIPESYRTKRPSEAETKTRKTESTIVTTGKSEEYTNFKAPYNEVWTAALESVEFLKWPIAFVDPDEGVIRLKEAYVYRKSGKLLRSYTYPSKTDIQSSSINDYLEKIAKYTPGTADTVYTQENLKVTLKKISDEVTEAKIDYSIRPYTYRGTIGYEVLSNGYIDSMIIDKMKERLTPQPVARN